MNNKRLYTIAVAILILSVSMLLVAPTSFAHDPPYNIPTYCYVTLSPRTVGVGEYTQVVMWLDKYPPTAGGTGGDRWKDLMVDITKPDGTKQTLGPFTTGPVGSTYTTFTPDQVGDYVFVLNFPGQVLTNGTGEPNIRGIPYVGDLFEASTSEPAVLHVQQEKIAVWPEAPLRDYWTRPITDENRAWSQLASNWLGGSWLVGNFQRFGQAPNSPHILWTKQLSMGGIADAQWPEIPYGTNDYEYPWIGFAPIIMNGQIFINNPMYPKYGYYALDLQTGEQLWYKNGTDNGLNNPVTLALTASGGGSGPVLTQTFPQLSFGQLYHYYSVNGHGILPYLWMTKGSTWYMLDANTGNLILTLVHVPGGTAVTDQDGSLLRYTYNSGTGNLLCWNSSQSIPPGGPTGTAQQQWKPMVGAVIDAVHDTIWTEYGPSGPGVPGSPTSSGTEWTESDILPRSGYTMNTTIDTGLPSSIRVLQDENRVPKMLVFSDFSSSGRFGAESSNFEVAVVRIDDHVAPYSPFPDKTFTQNTNLGFGATLLWDKSFTYPLGGNTTFSLGATSYDDLVYTVQCKETSQTWGYSMENGALLWGPTTSQGPWNMYGISDNVAYGKLFQCGYEGVLACIDIKTGDLLWTYNATQIGYESPYGNFPLSISAIADGKVFLTSGEHSPSRPMWRGSYLRCVNATDGSELWKLQDFNMQLGVADGYIVGGNMYDTKLYVIGKGPSATTVSTPDTSVPLGTTVLIKGTVTDQSPGAKGTPAISDANMEAWMEYLYEQQGKPSDVTGVSVKLTSIDPNGNFQDIGSATSDSNGNYGFMWTPPVPGMYQIVATFEGSESYGGSDASTYLAVGEALPSASGSVSPTATSSPAPTQSVMPTQTPIQTVSPSPSQAPQPTSGTPTTTYIAIGVTVIVIVAVAAALILRRRK